MDWKGYRERYGNIQRLDRILEAENDSVNRYKASKQADVLMLFYLLSADELRELFARMGYRFTPDQIPETVDYYFHRTSHGSTLSGVVHAWVLARGNRDRAMRYFQQVLMSDVADIQGGTTAEGIHIAAMAGSIDLLQRCFTGLETRGRPADPQPDVAGKPWCAADADLLPRLPDAPDHHRPQRGDQCRPGRPSSHRDRMPGQRADPHAGDDTAVLLVVCGWWLWLEGVVPPPVGAFAGRPGIGRDVGWWTGGGTGE